MTPTAFCTHPDMVAHDPGPHHPERPDRLKAIFQAVREAGLVDSPNPFQKLPIKFGGLVKSESKLIELAGEPAKEKWIELIHSRDYIDHVRKVSEAGGVLDQGDTAVFPGSFDAALLSLGCVFSGVDAVMAGRARRAFAAVRPPGHHAEPDRAMGFCLFSNIAIAARYVQKRYNIARVAIVDFDVHHGNGTQACFDHDPTVFFASLHQHPRTCYPGSGMSWEIGMGPGRGYTLNIPFDPGAGDDDYLAAMDEGVLPALGEFDPQVLLISAGFDAHADDPLAEINLSDSAFEMMTRSLTTLADRHCNGRIISVLEGGYNLAALGRCVVRHLIALSE